MVFTLAEVGRRADGDGIDTASVPRPAARRCNFSRWRLSTACLNDSLTTRSSVLEEKIEEIKAAVSSCVETLLSPSSII